VRAAVLQRKCACEQHAIGGECEECRKKDRAPASRGSLQRRASTAISAPAKPRFSFDFSRLPVHTPGEPSEAWNGPDSEGKPSSPKESKKPTMGSGQKTTPACTPPTGVRLVSSAGVEFPGYLTGGGICALMRLLPETDDVCHVNPKEELTGTSDTTCPDSLFHPSLCHGDSEFPLGKRPTKGPCKSLDPRSTEFSDRHTANLSGTSVLHDSKRNLKVSTRAKSSAIKSTTSQAKFAQALAVF